MAAVSCRALTKVPTLPPSSNPWVDDRSRDVFKVRCVAGRESGMMGQHNTSDHRVAQAALPAFPLPRRHQISCLLRGSSIKRSNSALDFAEGSFERLHQQRSSLSGEHDLQAESDLKNRH